MSLDPFATAALRESVLAAWRSSPTRFREDANAEEDLYLGGYRDRLLVELAQNAADAAVAAGRSGTLQLSIVDGELRAANTGAVLDAGGVAALASLRASPKSGGVGQFGLGFAAVLAVCDAPRVVSRSGGVEFSATRTAVALEGLPELATRVAERGGRVPVLRLVWPCAEGEPVVPDGFDTEVRLPLRSGVDGSGLLRGFAGQVPDLLLALPGLERIQVGDDVWVRSEVDGRIELSGPDGMSHWLVVRHSGELAGDTLARLGTEARTQWTVCWAVPVTADGVPLPLEAGVLHAPTPTDERMSLPARLIASLPIEPSRRRVLPGEAADLVLAEAAGCYPELLGRVEPLRRTALVPLPEFPLSQVDGQVRELVLAALRVARWLPAPGDRPELAPARAIVLDLPSGGLAELLAGVLPGMLDGELAAPAYAKALTALGVTRLRPAELVAAVTGIDRAPTWWHDLYQALIPLAELDSSIREELGGLPVPLLDGRTVPGPRGVLLVEADAGLFAVLAHVDVSGFRVVHPLAAHPLLERLGAVLGNAADLLDSDPLQEAVEHSLDDVESGMDTSGLIEAVLRLISEVGARPGDHPWLGALALPDVDGDWRRADELALPGSTFLEVLAEDSPLGVLADRLAKAWPAQVLTATGVLDSFALVDDEEPTGPDHDLDGEADWWDGLTEPPARVLAVRDLDLVADDAWPSALRLLAGDPETWRALQQPGGYTGWWLARNALLAGAPPRTWRLPSAEALAGLYDPVPDLGLAENLLVALGVRTELVVPDRHTAEDFLARLGDPDRAIQPGVVLRAHAALAESGLAPEEVAPPDRVRTLDGRVMLPDDVVVLDKPWLLGVLADDRVIAAGEDLALADPLAELLDLPLAEAELDAVVGSAGEPVAWTEMGAVVAACDLLDLDLPRGSLIVHDALIVRADGAPHRVAWWIDLDDVVHVEDSADALARALAWLTDRWPDRHTLAALITDPEPRTQLG